MNNIPYLLALHSIDGLGPIRLKAILDYFKNPKIAWEANQMEFQKIGIPKNTLDLLIETRKNLDPQKYLEDIQKMGIKWMTIFDEDYPKLLREIYDPPLVLYYKGTFNRSSASYYKGTFNRSSASYYKGQINSWDDKAIAVVGTRKMTGYGKAVTAQFTKELSDAGLMIVSGLARGVDSEAHWTTVKGGGQTIAVLGGGLNKIFPPENQKLADEIINGHGIITAEFPPDYPSLPGNFPSRNRIISGLSLATLVTEAAEDSGSLITARLALEQNREVFAVPGPVTSNLSKGPIDLIKEGARVVFSPAEILDELGIRPGMTSQGKRLSQLELTEDEKKVLDILENEQLHIDEICRKLNLPAAVISGTLLKMEITGYVQNLGSGMYCRV